MESINISKEDFSQTVLGYEGDAPSWENANFTYYRKLYTKELENGTIEMKKHHISRGPKNYNDESSIFYFIFDRVRKPQCFSKLFSGKQ